MLDHVQHVRIAVRLLAFAVDRFYAEPVLVSGSKAGHVELGDKRKFINAPGVFVDGIADHFPPVSRTAAVRTGQVCRAARLTLFNREGLLPVRNRNL